MKTMSDDEGGGGCSRQDTEYMQHTRDIMAQSQVVKSQVIMDAGVGFENRKGAIQGRRGSDEEVNGFEISEREKQTVHTSIRRSVVYQMKLRSDRMCLGLSSKQLNWSSQQFSKGTLSSFANNLQGGSIDKKAFLDSHGALAAIKSLK
jgi:hypothetical protein